MKTKSNYYSIFFLPLLLFTNILLISCNDNLSQFISEAENNKLLKDTDALHITSVTLNSVDKRKSYWTVSIRYSDSLNQTSPAYLKATIANPYYTTYVSHVMGRQISYSGDYDGEIIDYNVQFTLPCVFGGNGNYHYKIFYYKSDGVTRIDEYWWRDAYHAAKLYPCTESVGYD